MPVDKKHLQISPHNVEEILGFDAKNSQGFCDSYVFGPETDTEKPLGFLYLVVQINHREKTAADVADAVATVLQYTYYEGDPKSPMRSFERALSRTNEILADLAEQGEISWIGKLHVTATVITENEMYVTQTGRAKAFLWRENELTEITQGLAHPEANTNPIKTFGNIASGELVDGDRVIMGGPDFFDFLAPNKIVPFLKEETVLKAAILLRRRLPQDTQRPFCALLIGFGEVTAPALMTPLAASTAPLTEATAMSSTGTEQAQSPQRPLKPSFMGRVQNFVRPPFNFIKKYTRKIGTGLKAKLPAKYRKSTNLSERENLDHLLPSEETTINLKTASHGKKFWRNLWPRFRRLPLKSKLFLGGALILILALIAGLIAVPLSRNNNATEAELQQLLSDAQLATENAEAAIILNNRQEATDYLNTATERLNELKERDGRAYTDQITELEGLIVSLQAKISNVSTLENVTEIFDFATLGETVAIQYLTYLNGSLIAADTNNNTYQLSLANKQLVNLSTASNNIGRIITGVPLTEEKTVVYLTNTPGLAKLTVANKTLKALTSQGISSTAISVDDFGSNLYTLDRAQNKIMKYPATTSGYNRGSVWITDGTSVANAIDFAVDGGIYVLLSDGKIVYLLRGKKQTFNLDPLTEPLSDPIQILTEPDYKKIYVLDPAKKRFITWDKSGRLQKQYTAEAFDNMLNLCVAADEKTAYVLNGTKVYEINL